jgi:hypothetical protein
MILNLGFLTEGNMLLYSSHLPLGVPNGLVIHHATSNNFLGLLPRKSGRPLQGEFFAHTSFTLLLFCFTLFLLASFYIKNTKKLVPTIVVIFVGLLLSCFVMLSINGWFL